MANKDKQKLNPSQTLEIKIGNLDQAKISNDLEKKPVSLHFFNPISKKEAVESLSLFIDTLLSDNPLKNAIEIAIREIGKCIHCTGKGTYNTDMKPDQNYSIRTNPKGYKYFVVKCDKCKGTGKQLDVQCVSCGKNASVMPDQRHVSYCHSCEKALIKSGTLL